MDLATVSTILAVVLILAGVIAIIFPFTPSILTIWFGIFVYIMGHGELTTGQNFFIIVSTIAFGTMFLDYTLGKSGMGKLRAGPWGVAGAVLGGLVGSFFGTVTSYIIGPIIGAIVFELLHGHDQVFSYSTGKYTVVGSVGNTLIKLLSSIIMISLFALRLQGKL